MGNAVIGGVGLPAVGFTIADVANDFDPSVSGLSARVGSVVGTVDQTKAWIKVSSSDTGWEPIHAS